MKIACLIHSLDGGGAERVMAGLASRLAARGHCVTLITLDDAKSDRHNVDAAVARVPLDVMSDGKRRGFFGSNPLGRLFQMRHRVCRIRSAIKTLDPEVVLSFCDRTNVLAGLAVDKRRSSQCSQSLQSPQPIPWVLCERSDPFLQTLPWVWRFLRKRSYRHAALVATQTERAAQYFSAEGPAPFGVPTAVVGSAVDEPPTIRDANAANAQTTILGVGRLAHEKGFDRLINAFARIAGEHPQWRLRILGEGDQRDGLTQLIAEHGLHDRIEMPGWIRPTWDELARASLFVLPSRYEGFPSALLEAMAVGVPSIALDCQVGSREIIQDGINGWIVGDSPEQLADAMTKWIQDEDLRERLGQEGKKVVDRFGWEAMTDRFETILKQACTRHSTPGE